jgi:hypothetical protein
MQIAPEDTQQGIAGRDPAVLQEVQDRSKRPSLGLRSDRFAKLLMVFELGAMLLLDGRQSGLQDV